MSEVQLEAVFRTPDGEVFGSKAEAQDHLRRPKILEAMLKITGIENKDLADWLVDNKDTVTAAFDSGNVRRVTKSEKNKLEKALKAIEDDGNKDFKFVIENSSTILRSFKWPTVKKMTDEEKQVAAQNTLIAASDGNEAVATWTIENEVAVLEAYNAGKEKRQVSPKAKVGLDAYRAGRVAYKEAQEAGKSETEASAIAKKIEEEYKAAHAV